MSAIGKFTRGALVASVSVCALVAAGIEARAQDARGQDIVPSAQARQTFSFSQSGQPLTSALLRFSKVTGIDVIADVADTRMRRAPAVSGTMTAPEALRRLLSGSDLHYAFTNGTTVVVRQTGAFEAHAQAIELATIEISTRPVDQQRMIGAPPPSYAGGQVATGGQLGMLGNRSVMDTPFNHTSYTRQTIQNQQARTITDVLADDPSVRFVLPAGSGLDSVYIRGFLVNSSDASFNGLYGIIPSQTATVNALERVEIIKGPSALLNGVPPGGSIGGSVNLVSKRATDEPITQLTTTLVAPGNVGSQVDVSRRFGAFKEIGVRFNGAYRDGETSIDNQSDAAGNAALSLDYRGERVRLAIDLIHQATKVKPPLRPISFLGTIPIPRAPAAGTNYMPDWYYMQMRDSIGMLHGEVDLLSNVTAYAQVGVHDNVFKGIYQSPTSVNAAGNFTQTPVTQSTYGQFMAVQAGVRATVDTGPVNHAINVNYSSLQREQGQGPGVNGTSFTSNIYAPRVIVRQNLVPQDGLRTAETDLSSFGIADTLSMFDRRIQVTAGVRRQQIAVDSYNGATQALTSRYDQSAWSPAYAVVLKPLGNVSLYANYIEGLQQGNIVSSGTFANVGEVFPPYQSKQMEAGVKVDFGQVTATVSVFDIAQPNLISVPGTPLPSQKPDGESRNRGIEFNVFGELFEGVRVLGGFMIIDARQEKTANGTNDGKRALGVPDFQANLGGEWDLPFLRGLTVNGRVIYTGGQFVNAANTQWIPDWTRVDLGMRYAWTSPWGKPATFRFTVENVFDNSYWASVFVGSLAVGAPRTYLLSTTFDF